MDQITYQNYMRQLNSSLVETEFTNQNRESIGQVQGLSKWIQITQDCAQQKKSIYLVGNGASAAMASHMSADACKNGLLRAKCLNDISLVTAISNDIEYKKVFAVQLERYAEKGDVLITISSSGNSPNIIEAIESARKIGMTVVTLSGMKMENKSRLLGDLNVYIPAPRYGFVESGHQAILHCWLDGYLETIGVNI